MTATTTKQLRIQDEQGNVVSRIQIGTEEITIGRDPKCTLHLAHNTVSRRHCRIFPDNGTWWAMDLKSANGVYLDGVPITSPTQLSETSVLTVGTFTIQLVDAPLRQTRAPMLTVQIAGEPNQRVPLSKPLTIGRDPTSDIIINHPGISRTHARITYQDSKGLLLEDLDSTNGIVVNKKRVQSYRITEKDKFFIGKTPYVLIPQDHGFLLRSTGEVSPSRQIPVVAWVVILASVLALGTIILLSLGLPPQTDQKQEEARIAAELQEERQKVHLETLLDTFASLLEDGQLNAASSTLDKVIALHIPDPRIQPGHQRLAELRQQEEMLQKAKQAKDQQSWISAARHLAQLPDDSPFIARAAVIAKDILPSLLEMKTRACERPDSLDCEQIQARIQQINSLSNQRY